tara:strand:- start:1691 stop:2257 length:567 start_codon:yes stop_codon:yes gene_type:complete
MNTNRSTISFDIPTTKKQMVVDKLVHLKMPILQSQSERAKASDKFWDAILQDIDDYERHIFNATPFEHTCYSRCSQTCLRNFDGAYWAYGTTGFKKRKFVSIYKIPTRLTSLVLVLLAGVFKMLRANSDGKVSFYGTILSATDKIIVFAILVADKEYIMSIPKIFGFVVTLIVLYGIVANQEQDGIGI